MNQYIIVFILQKEGRAPSTSTSQIAAADRKEACFEAVKQLDFLGEGWAVSQVKRVTEDAATPLSAVFEQYFVTYAFCARDWEEATRLANRGWKAPCDIVALVKK